MTAAELSFQAQELPDLASVDDIEWGVRLLAATPTHEGRDRELLRQWARRADEFGAQLAPVPSTARVVERDGGLELMLLARYTSRPPTVELYTDTGSNPVELDADLDAKLVVAHSEVAECDRVHRCAVNDNLSCNADGRTVLAARDQTTRSHYLLDHRPAIASCAAAIQVSVRVLIPH